MGQFDWDNKCPRYGSAEEELKDVDRKEYEDVLGYEPGWDENLTWGFWRTLPMVPLAVSMQNASVLV